MRCWHLVAVAAWPALVAGQGSSSVQGAASGRSQTAVQGSGAGRGQTAGQGSASAKTSSATPSADCQRADEKPAMWLEVASSDARGWTARLCTQPSTAGLSSYAATILYDSVASRLTSVDTRGGMQVANTQTRGEVRLAGADPSGFKSGRLATLHFTWLTRSTRGLVLQLREASALDGSSVTASMMVAGAEAPAGRARAAAVPRIDSLSPKSGRVSGEGVLDVTIHGRGFEPRGNVVYFGAARIDSLLSESDGTIIRFIAPRRVPVTKDGGGPIAPGSVAVRVETPGGRSNAVTFTVRGGR